MYIFRRTLCCLRWPCRCDWRLCIDFCMMLSTRAVYSLLIEGCPMLRVSRLAEKPRCASREHRSLWSISMQQ